jgi:hypothetical protein
MIAWLRPAPRAFRSSGVPPAIRLRVANWGSPRMGPSSSLSTWPARTSKKSWPSSGDREILRAPALRMTSHTWTHFAPGGTRRFRVCVAPRFHSSGAEGLADIAGFMSWLKPGPTKLLELSHRLFSASNQFSTTLICAGDCARSANPHPGMGQKPALSLSINASRNNLVYPEGPQVYKWTHWQVKMEVPAKRCMPCPRRRGS